MSLWGPCVVTPVFVRWFPLADRIVGTAPGLKTALSKAALTSMVTTVPMNALFFTYNSYFGAGVKAARGARSALALRRVVCIDGRKLLQAAVRRALNPAARPSRAEYGLKKYFGLQRFSGRSHLPKGTPAVDPSAPPPGAGVYEDEWDHVNAGIRYRLQHDLPRVTLTSWSIWIPVNTTIWMLCPPQFRVIFLSTVTMGWTTFLSLVQHREVPSAQ